MDPATLSMIIMGLDALVKAMPEVIQLVTEIKAMIGGHPVTAPVLDQINAGTIQVSENTRKQIQEFLASLPIKA